MKLTSISAHSDWLDDQGIYNEQTKWNLHRKRVAFGKQPLELWMFTNEEKSLFIYNPFFESFTQSDMDNQTIENLLSDDFDYFLNETAQKQLAI